MTGALALLAIPFLLLVVWGIGQPDGDDYARCRGLDKVEE